MPIKKKRKKFFNYKTIFVLILVFFLFLVFSLIKEIINRHQIDVQIANLEAEINELEQNNSEIENLISSWASSNRLEREARLKLGLKKPDEKSILILREEEQNEIIDFNEELMSPKDNSPNPIKWWQYFFNR